MASEDRRQEILHAQAFATVEEIKAKDSIADKNNLRALIQRAGSFSQPSLLNEIGRMYLPNWERIPDALISQLLGELVDESAVITRYIPVTNSFLQGVEPSAGNQEMTLLFMDPSYSEPEEAIKEHIQFHSFKRQLLQSKGFFNVPCTRTLVLCLSCLQAWALPKNSDKAATTLLTICTKRTTL